MHSNTRINSLKNRIVGLDELRGIAILIVMISHGRGFIPGTPKFLAGIGHYGVILFFFISGFIISKILLNEKLKYESQQISRYDYFSTFYIRRIFRIIPLYYLSLLVSAILFPETAQYFMYSVTFLQNYFWAHTDQIMMRTDVSWSLAIEEHMYILLPMIILFFREHISLVIISSVIILGYLFYAQILPLGPFEAHRYFVTHTNMQYIAFGALLAFGRTGKFAVIVLSLIWIIASIFLDKYGFKLGKDGLNGQFVDIILLASVYLVIHGKYDWVTKIPALKYLGVRCYGLYLIHFFVSTLSQEIIGRNMMGFTFYFALSIILAEISYKYFEEPIQNYRVVYENNKTLSKEFFKLFATFLLINLTLVIFL